MISIRTQHFCLVAFQKHPIPGVSRFVLFNRDEQLRRTRSALGVHFGPPHKIVCGVDHRCDGTWLGVNLDTANYGFITNYENLPKRKIEFKRYKRSNLLLEYLKE